MISKILWTYTTSYDKFDTVPSDSNSFPTLLHCCLQGTWKLGASIISRDKHWWKRYSDEMRGCWKEGVGLVAVVLKHSFCHLSLARFHSQHHYKLSQKIWQNYGDNKEIERPQSYSRPHCLDACYHVLQASHKWSHKPNFSHASVQKAYIHLKKKLNGLKRWLFLKLSKIPPGPRQWV